MNPKTTVVRRGARLGVRDADHGHELLMLHIIARAAKDLRAGSDRQKRSAIDYFLSERYEADMRVLGLDPELAPKGL